MKHESSPTVPPDPSAGYERSDMNLRPVVHFGIWFAAFLVVAHVIMLIMFHVLGERVEAPMTPQSPQIVSVDSPIAGPRLEVTPSTNWEEMRERQNQMLHSYGWVNPQAGIVRIPIDRAIELALQRGFPVRPAATRGAAPPSEN